MSTGTVTTRKICEQIQDLPEESLLELSHYIEFLQLRSRPVKTKKPKPSLRVVKLGGILKGYDFSPELLAQARQAMWKKYEDTRP